MLDLAAPPSTSPGRPAALPPTLPRGRGTEPLTELAATVAAGALSSPAVPAELPAERGGVLVHAGADFDVWLLWWPPGTSVSPHDHGRSSGAFSVVSGELVEVRWSGGERRTRRVGAGATVGIAEGVVHDVICSDGGALSVHVYSPPLTEMGYYDDSGCRLVARRPVAADGHDDPPQ